MINTNRLHRVISYAAAALFIFGIGIAPAAFSGEPAKAKFTMNVGNVAGSDHSINLALRDFKKAVEEKTGGEVVVDIYDNSVLGGELELVEQCIMGTLESAIIMGAGNWEMFDLAAGFSVLPFLFDSIESSRKAWTGLLGDKFSAEIVEPHGAKVISYWESGFRHFTNNVRPIVEPEDVAGIKFRISQTEMKSKMFRALDSSAIQISFGELFTALQQGTVQGQENPVSNIYATSLYEVQDYLSLTGHMHDCCLFLVSPEWWESLPEYIQEIIQTEADVARDKQFEYNDESAIITLLEEAGMKVNTVNKPAFAEKMQSVWKEFAESTPNGQYWIDIALEAQK